MRVSRAKPARPGLRCAVCKGQQLVVFQKAGNFVLPLCVEVRDCAERVAQRAAAGGAVVGV